MKIIEKNDGQKIAYEASGNKLTLEIGRASCRERV